MMILLVILVLVLLLAFVLKPSRKADVYSRSASRGKAGESNVSFILHTLPQEYLVIDDVTIPDQGAADKGYTTQIDHVVVSPYGVFVIETKNYRGWIFGNEDSKKWKQTFKTTEAQYLYNPVKQNWGHVFALAERLRLNVKVFRPIVVFSDGCELHLETTTPVVYMSQFRDHILSYTQEILSQNDADLIYDRLNRIRLAEEDLEKEHVQSIGERFIKRESAVEQGKCPRCGGQLVARKGRYGVFYGCSNYPKCKFTHDL